MKVRIVAKLRPVLAACIFTVSFWSCGGASGGISGTSNVAGPIEEFGSIVVNGIELDTTDAAVTIEGDPAEVADLRLGMFVFVRGPVNRARATGVAERVASDHLLEGPVDQVDVSGGLFLAFSQVVLADADTVFEGATPAALSPGDLVEVFGVRDADDNIRATRVERKAAVEELEVTGTVAALDQTAETFRIGMLTVDFSDALIEDAPPGGLADGLLVEVEAEDPPVDDVLTAVGVEVRDPELPFEAGDGADVSGFVTEVVSLTEIVLNREQRVLIADGTRFERGVRGDLVLNAEVDASGTLEADGALLAEEIEFLSIPRSP